jgi:poly(3-hydroxybutyrate) depolymerase
MTRLLLVTLALFPVLAHASPAPPNAPPGTIELRQGMVIGRVGTAGRSPVHTDAVEARIVAGRWAPPHAGETLTLPDGTQRAWEAITAGPDGAFTHRSLGGGYLYVPVELPRAQAMLLEASGHGMVYVNGEPRAGDPYGYGSVRLPVALRAGRNDLLFQGGRGGPLRARLVPVSAPAMLHTGDMTLPDLRVGEAMDAWGAVIVLNTTDKPLTALSLAVTGSGRLGGTSRLPAIPPLSSRKVGFRLRGPAPRAPRQVEATLRLLAGRSRVVVDTARVSLRVRRPAETYKRSFISKIDGSVQYYAVNPAASDGEKPPALVLSLHGASVEAIGQADAYSPKSWAHLVAPTNRRPYGFDWEDWGRLDALEVLRHARRSLGTDPARTYLTGHSMGGHGTWHLGVTYPDQFAAIGPSAGWISFWSYAGGRRFENPGAVEQLLTRAAAPSDTLTLSRNLAPRGVYILHGDADDNVPVTEARTMREHLSAFHRDLAWHEQPGAGHWWDSSPEPGAECVDWAPMFDHFARRRLPADREVRDVSFTTANPAVSARCHWATIEAQERALVPSSVSLRCDPLSRRFAGATTNVARLSLSVAHLAPGAPLAVELDGQTLAGIPWPSGEPRLWLERGGGRWKVATKPSAAVKGPHRAGPFKDAFRHRMLFLYGTRGTPEENRWAYTRARYDSEAWWYRGNGAVDVVADTDFQATSERHRSVILYGNADTNAAWRELFGESPVQVRRGAVRVGDREQRGEDLACLFLRPRPDSDTACVAAVSGTGPAGMRLTDRLPYFVSGVAFPDVTVIGPEMLVRGTEGIRGAGFFGNDWRVETGEFAWREAMDKNMDRTAIKRRSVILTLADLNEPRWLPALAEAGVNTLMLHAVRLPEDIERLITFRESPAGEQFLAECKARGIAVEYQMHTASWLVPRGLFATKPEIFRMDLRGRRTSDTNFCASSEEAWEVFAERARDLVTRLPSDTGR